MYLLVTFATASFLVSVVLEYIMCQLNRQVPPFINTQEMTPWSHKKRKAALFSALFPFYYLSYLLLADWWIFLPSGIFITFMAFISIMDFEQQVILDSVLLFPLLFVLLFSVFFPVSFLDRLSAAAIGSFIMLFLAILTKGGIGGGDIKLIFVIGLWLGLDSLVFTLVAGFLSGGLAAALLLICKLKKSKDTIAYGPYFALWANIAFILQKSAAL